MIGSRHLHTAKLFGDGGDSFIVRRNNYLQEALRLLTTFDDPLNQRLAGNRRKRFPRKACRAVSRWDDARNFHPRVLATSRQNARFEFSHATECYVCFGFSLPASRKATATLCSRVI